MKSFHYFTLLLLVSLLVVSCKNDITDMGVSIQPSEDKIYVRADTFHVTSDSYFVEKIYARPDSFLLGTYSNKKYGGTKADILAQFKFPFDEGAFRFPENATVDSVVLSLSYNSWFGADNSVMAVNIYRMNKGDKLSYSTYYPSNINPDEYVDYTQPNVLLGERAFTAKDATGTKDSTRITIKLSDHFSNELFGYLKDETITDQDDFTDKFNGMFITTNFGDATMMHIREKGINTYLYYRYQASIEGKDTVFTNMILLPANSEVTQINRFQHPDVAEVKAYLEQNDSVNLISSPANIYTRVQVPVRKMVQNMLDSLDKESPNKRLIVNNAILRVDAKDIKNTEMTNKNETALPIPANLLLIEEDNINDFFSRDLLPNDSTIIGDFTSADSCYKFNIAKLLTQEIEKVKNAEREINVDALPDRVSMVLVPVSITASYDTYGTRTISKIRQRVLMSGVTIRSSKDKNYPMKLELIYSGF